MGAFASEPGSREPSPAVSALPGFDPSRVAVARCIQIAIETEAEFLDPDYAGADPIASFSERFACSQVRDAMEREFAMSSTERRRLLGLPSHAEELSAQPNS